MVCESDADVDIKIPAVMLPQDAGSNLEKYINNNTRGMTFFLPHFFYVNVTVDPASLLFWKILSSDLFPCLVRPDIMSVDFKLSALFIFM